MSSNRLSYDKCAYKQSLLQSVAPVEFSLDPIAYEHCNKCRPELGIVGGSAVSHINGNLVDLENDLRGQTRPLTKCPTYMYTPPQGHLLESKEYIKPVQHPVIDTRMNHLPACQLFDYAEVPTAPVVQPATCPGPAHVHAHAASHLHAEKH